MSLVLDAGYWVLGAGCWMLDAGCWMKWQMTLHFSRFKKYRREKDFQKSKLIPNTKQKERSHV